MNILDKIVARKKQEIAERKAQKSLLEIEKSLIFDRTALSFAEFLNHPNKTGVIAEFKRRSPSKGIINDSASVQEVTQGYQNAGASAVSILTDIDFFGGKDEDLILARPALNIPILRKDFVIDPYQLFEAKALGADVILLIAAVLTPKELSELGKQAFDLGLSVLLEVHSREELDRSINPYATAIGVNNRNLGTFATDVNTSFELAEHIPSEFVKVSESAIDSVELIKELRKVGYKGFLIGENFMKSANPAQAAADFLAKL